MTLLILCVMLCIVGPLPKVSALSSSDLEGKVENLESKLEAMSTVVFRLNKQNEKLETVVDTLIGEKELLKRRVNHLEQMVQDGVARNDEGSDTTEGVVMVDKAGKQKGGIMRITDKVGILDEEGDSKGSDDRIQQNRKRLLEQPTPSMTGVVAFHAYLSKDSTGPLPAYHILKFDGVSLNKGHGYTASEGIFVPPTSGTYVFTWSIMADVHGNVFTQLMKNSDIIGTRVADSTQTLVWDFATGIVVVDVKLGDHVYVQLKRASVGKVLSVVDSRTTFSGWLLN